LLRKEKGIRQSVEAKKSGGSKLREAAKICAKKNKDGDID
jgi:hypothetical protein